MMPDSLLTAAVAPFIGSFLGTLAVRLPSGEPILVARSACPECGATLHARELIPLASWLAQGGKCRSCKAPISAFYPAIELGALAIVVWAALSTQGIVLLLSCLLGWALLTLAVMDWRTLRLADAVTLPLVAAGLGAAFLVDRAHLLDHAIGAVAGFLLIYALAALYRAVRGRDGLGLGDAKLLAAGGAWVAWQGIGSILVVASVAALLGVLLWRLAGRHIGADTRLPFGAFLAFGIWLVWLYGPLVSG